MKRLSQLDKDHPDYKPLYLSNNFNRESRKIDKFLAKDNWFIPGQRGSNDWKCDVPQAMRKFRQQRGRAASQVPSAVLFVPNSNKSILLKKLEQKEPLLARLSGYTIRLVESSGTPLSRHFSLDLSDGLCHRIDCLVCASHTGKGSSKCRKSNIVYKSTCNLCKATGSNQGTYIGESGRTLYERSLEHLADAKNRKTSSHIWKHWALCHGTTLTHT